MVRRQYGNRHPAVCVDCGQTVAAHAGVMTNATPGAKRPTWQVRHAPAQWVGSPVSGQWVGGCPKVEAPSTRWAAARRPSRAPGEADGG